MRILVFLILLLSFTQKAWSKGCEDAVECSKVYSALAFKVDDGQVISEVRSRKAIYPASLVKLMTVYLAFEAIDKGKLQLNDEMVVSERGEEISAVNKVTTLKLVAGDKIKVKDAIRGTIIKSFNEAAVTLAEAVAGDEWRFARLMNNKAYELGMYDTSFRNSTGLHEEGQYTTAYDLARLVQALRTDFAQYYHYFAEEEFSFNGKNFVTHNHVLREYPGAEGMKTGFTRASGFNLISAAKKQDNRVVSILANCKSYKSRDEQTKDIFNESFAWLKEESSGSKLKSLVNDSFKYENKNPKDYFKNYYKFAQRFGGGI